MADERAILSRWLRRAGPWVLAASVLYLVGNSLAAKATLPHGEPAPSVVVDLHGGSHFDLAEQRGKVVVLNFWGTYCPPCRAEAPVLARAHAALGEDGLVLGLSVDRYPLGRVAEAAESFGMDYPIAMAPEAVVRDFGVELLPTTYVLAPDGTISAGFVGEIDDETLDEAIAHAREHR